MLKKYVCNKANSKGCIASEYMYDEALAFCIMYFAWYPHIRCWMWDAKEQEVNIREILVGKGKHNILTVEELKAIHEYIITNSTTIKVAYMYFELYLLYKSIVIVDLNFKL
jgi:hypothetical protein